MLPNYEHAFKNSNGKWIFVPTDESREQGYAILKEIHDYWEAPKYFYHLQTGGHVAALKAHQNKKFYVRADIKRFFSSISRNRIVSSLKKTGLFYKRSKEIADTSTVMSKETPHKKVLPFGFVQSPILASIALDHSAVGKFLRSDIVGVTRTVYADDFLYSSDDKEILQKTYLDLQKSISQSGFAINNGKSHAPQEQTCIFNVDITKNSLKISDSRYQEFTDEMFGMNRLRSEAIAHYVRTINLEQSNKLLSLFKNGSG
jgi:hypothetical protein